MSTIEVTLDPYEYAGAVQVGLQRHTNSMVRRDRNSPTGVNHGYDWLGWLSDAVIGALGERAAAKALGCYWPGGVDTFHRIPDLGGRTEVRTRRDHRNQLIVKVNDPPDRVYVHVTGTGPTFWIHGAILGRDAQRESWLDNLGYGPLYLVPSNELLPVGKIFTAFPLDL